MKDQSLIVALMESSANVESQLLIDAQRFLSAVEMVSQAIVEEAVPAEMMQVFTDEQWLELLFELQPGTTLFQSDYDIAGLHQNWITTGSLVLPQKGEAQHRLLFQDQEGLIVRLVNLEESRAIEMTIEGRSFSEMAAVLWPNLEQEAAHQKMTAMLLNWLQDGLIIDAGVPLPADAVFEQGAEPQ